MTRFAQLARLNASGAIAKAPLPNESSYYEVWHTHVRSESDLLARAVLGGLYADRFAWVFLAGYQPAVEHTFGSKTKQTWTAFAVSEDATGAKAPLTWVARGDEFVLNGCKTWVAGVAHCRHLVVKAGRGQQARYFIVDRAHTGISLSTKTKGFLAEMTEGIAEFSDVILASGDLVDTSAVKQFGTREFLYIYAAFCAMVASRCEDRGLGDLAWSLIDRLSSLLESTNIPATMDVDELKAVDLAIQQLRRDAQPHMQTIVGWEKDQRLIAVYSKPIQSR